MREHRSQDQEWSNLLDQPHNIGYSALNAKASIAKYKRKLRLLTILLGVCCVLLSILIIFIVNHT